VLVIIHLQAPGLVPGVIDHLYAALWEHIVVVKHFLPPAPTSADIERLDALTISEIA
jgi:hypothetical protein